MSTTTKTPTTAHMLAISTAHAVTDEGIAARVAAVMAALAAGTDVKTLAATMATAAQEKGSSITAVGQTVLGHAKGAATILTKTGVSPDYDDAAHVAALAAAYRAIQRHGVAAATKDIVGDAVNGKTPAAKLARITKSATAKTTEAIAARKSAGKPRVKTESIAAGKSTPASVIKGIAGSLAAGKLAASPELTAAIAALVEANRLATVKTTATPATVAAQVAA